MAASASAKDEAFREYALTAPPLKVLFSVCGPLAIYQAMQQIFSVLDTLMAAHIGAGAVSAIASLTQITAMITAIGSGLAVGGCIRISEAYGEGNYDAVRRRTSTLYALAVAISLLVTVLLIPFAEPVLRILKTPEELIETGAGYFRVQILTLMLSFFNTVYIAIERSRGHSRKILALNLVVVVLKIGLSAVFVYLLDGDVMMIAIATLVSQLALTVYALISMPRDVGAFRFSVKEINFRRSTLLPMLNLSYPVAAEKLLFAAGKVMVNAMSGMYGAMTVGALGISNNIGGFTTNWHSGTQDGATALVSQNRGAGKYKRTLSIFWWLLLVDVLIGLIGYIVISFCLPGLAEIFAKSKESFDKGFCDMIVDIHRFEMLGYITLGVNSAVNALLMGYGKVKTTMALNVARVFVFRVPVLWYLQHFTSAGYEAAGITMMVSNVATGIASAVVAIPVVREIMKKEEK